MPQIRSPAPTTSSFPAHISALLDRLHAESKAEENAMDMTLFAARDEEVKSAYVRDKFIALDADKAQFVYSMIRATDARVIVEAGTSFGVSTIYLAIGAAENEAAAAARVNGGSGKKARVVATEHEPSKAERARGYWKECGDLVTDVIELREGDLRETLKDDLDEVDFLLLDIWTPMVMPTLKVVQPKLRRGAVIIADNTLTSRGYDEFIEYTRDPANGFVNVTVPYENGLEMCIYLP